MNRGELRLKIRINLKIFLIIILFLLTKQIEIYGIVMLFALIHELGHLLAGLLLGLKPETISIMPAGLAICFKTEVQDYNNKINNTRMISIKKIIIAIAGPLTNLIIAIICIITNVNNSLIIYANILLAIFNLIPIYPLDGGRIAKEFFSITNGMMKSYNYTHIVSKLCIIIITMITSVAILYYKNIAILLILTYLWIIYIRENKFLEQKYNLYKMLLKDRILAQNT